MHNNLAPRGWMRRPVRGWCCNADTARVMESRSRGQSGTTTLSHIKLHGGPGNTPRWRKT